MSGSGGAGRAGRPGTYPSPASSDGGGFRFKLGESIGTGAFGDVYLALNERNGALMAAKTMDVRSARTDIQALRNEIDLLR